MHDPVVPEKTKFCPRCERDLPIATSFNSRGGSKPHLLQAYCKECKNEQAAAWRAKNAEHVRVKAREKYEREMRDAEKKKRRQEYDRERRRRDRAIPERKRQLAEASRRYRIRLQTDPERHRRHLDMRKIDRRLRRIDAGLPVIERSTQTNRRVQVDSAPLIPFLKIACAKACDDMSENAYRSNLSKNPKVMGATALSNRINVDEQVIAQIITGERPTIMFDTADRIAIGLDLTFDLIYDLEDVA